jgi:hypothetical protein
MMKAYFIGLAILSACAGSGQVSKMDEGDAAMHSAQVDREGWEGYDEKRHTDGWAEMAAEGYIKYQYDEGVFPPSVDNRVAAAFPENGPLFDNIMDNVGGLKPGERKRMRKRGPMFQVADDKSFQFYVVLRTMTGASERAKHIVSINDKEYPCFNDYIGYRKIGFQYYIYYNQMEVIEKCLEGKGFKYSVPWKN